MSITIRICALFVTVVCFILAAYGTLAYGRERSMIRRDVVRDLRLLGRTMRAAIEAARESEGVEAATRLVERENRQDASVQFEWVWLDESPPDIEPSGLEDLLRGRAVLIDPAAPADAGGAAAIGLLIPLHDDGDRPAALRVTHSLDAERAHLRSTVRELLIAALTVVVLAGALGFAIGHRVVGEPLRQLVRQADRIGHGDLSPPEAPVRARGEIAEVAEAIDGMRRQLARSRRRMEAEAERRITALERLRHSERLASVGRLTAGIAHELGAPLSVVLGRARLIADQAERAGAEAGDARIIGEQARRMKRIIHQLLDLARRPAGEPRALDLRALCRSAATPLQTMAAERGVEIVLVPNDEPVTVRGDPDRLEQVATNLIVNAIQATSSEGGRVEVRADTAHAVPPADHGGSPAVYARLAVEDHGGGIAPADLPHLFEPFFTTKKSGEGTGLGLAITREVVLEHGGWIEVASRTGAGSTFIVHLPLRRSTAEAGESEREEAA